MTNKNGLIFHLAKGAHKSPQQGVCAMEAVAFLAREPHSDRPQCACPVIAAYVRLVNDSMSDDQRQRLVPYLPRIIGSRSPEHELERMQIIVWHVLRVIVPDALRAVGLNDQAKELAEVDNLARADEVARTAGDAALNVFWLAEGDAKDIARAVYDACHAASCAAADADDHVAADMPSVAIYAACAADYVDALDESLICLDKALSAGPQGCTGYDFAPPQMEVRHA